jgi:hypothetical protein
MRLRDLVLDPDGRDSAAFGEALDRADEEDVRDLVALASHGDPRDRSEVALALPLAGRDELPSEDAVAVMIGLSTDTDRRVRDYGCMALGTQWREIDTPQLRDALAARLDDIDRDAACEALLGLAYRADSRAVDRISTSWSNRIAADGIPPTMIGSPTRSAASATLPDREMTSSMVSPSCTAAGHTASPPTICCRGGT